MASFHFNCSACGRCCNSAPQLSVPELFHHRERFVGCLSLRRVRRLRELDRYADGSGATQEDVGECDALARRLFHELPGERDYVFLFSHGFSFAHLGACPALGSDQRCNVHHDRKPTVCGSVPLEATLPDRLQRVVLAQRSAEARYLAAHCLSSSPFAESKPLVRALRVIDSESHAWLEQRRRDLEADRRHWGERVFQRLAAELFRSPGSASIPANTDLTLSLSPVLVLLAGISPNCRQRVIEYARAQRELFARINAFSVPDDATTRREFEQLAGLRRANDALLGVIERAPPSRWSATAAAAAEVEAWLN